MIPNRQCVEHQKARVDIQRPPLALRRSMFFLKRLPTVAAPHALPKRALSKRAAARETGDGKNLAAITMRSDPDGWPHCEGVPSLPSRLAFHPCDRHAIDDAMGGNSMRSTCDRHAIDDARGGTSNAIDGPSPPPRAAATAPRISAAMPTRAPRGLRGGGRPRGPRGGGPRRRPPPRPATPRAQPSSNAMASVTPSERHHVTPHVGRERVC